MTQNPLRRLAEYGQSIWLDLLSREIIHSGELRKLIEEDSVTGVTSNPAIFEKAMTAGHEYDEDIRTLAAQQKDSPEVYETMAVQDIKDAADLLRPIYDRTSGLDGYVSLEVSPLLAHETAATIAEARRLWAAVNRPNLMVKIPGTRAGLAAITESTAAGINVNVTLLFSVERYKEAAEAYIRGLELRDEKGGDLRHVRSVASFFLSRIDVILEERLGSSPDLQGRAAIASAKIAYQEYKDLFGSPRFRKLEEKGARKQWLLWGSTSTKTKGLSDVLYVEALIGPETVNTMPIETLEAYRDHGHPEPQLEKNIDEAHQVMKRLRDLQIDLAQVTQQLEDEGVEKFVKPFNSLMRSLEEKTRSLSVG
jgi:transaldolase